MALGRLVMFHEDWSKGLVGLQGLVVSSELLVAAQGHADRAQYSRHLAAVAAQAAAEQFERRLREVR
jgi:hypothetical protein